MALQQYKKGSTYFGYNPEMRQGVAYADPKTFSYDFPGGFNPNAPAPTFDTAKLLAAPNQLLTLDPATPVSVDAVKQGPLNLPGGSPPTDPTGFVNFINQPLQDFASLERAAGSPTQAAADTERKGLLGRLQDLGAKLTGRGTALQQEEERLGIPENEKRLSELNVQIAELSNQFNRQFEAVEGKPIPMPFITGEQSQIRRQQAVEIGALATLQAALQGNIDLASQRAKRTVDLQFEPIEQEIRNTERFLELNADTLTREERKQAERMAYGLEQRKTLLADQKENRTLALTNGVQTRFFKLPGDPTVMDTSTGERLSYEEYQKRGGQGVLGSFFPDVTGINPSKPAEQELVTDLAGKYPDAGITLTDSLVVAQQKLQGSRIYRQATRLVGGGGVGSGRGQSDIEDYAQAVFSGSLKLTGVPQKIRGKVDARVKQLQSSASSKYETEFEARVDYDQEIRALQAAKEQGTLIGSPNQIIQSLANAYGSRISIQEIESAIYNIFGVDASKKPKPAAPLAPRGFEPIQPGNLPR